MNESQAKEMGQDQEHVHGLNQGQDPSAKSVSNSDPNSARPVLGLFQQWAARAKGEAPILSPVLPSRFENQGLGFRSSDEFSVQSENVETPQRAAQKNHVAESGLVSFSNSASSLRNSANIPEETTFNRSNTLPSKENQRENETLKPFSVPTKQVSASQVSRQWNPLPNSLEPSSGKNRQNVESPFPSPSLSSFTTGTPISQAHSGPSKSTSKNPGFDLASPAREPSMQAQLAVQRKDSRQGEEFKVSGQIGNSKRENASARTGQSNSIFENHISPLAHPSMAQKMGLISKDPGHESEAKSSASSPTPAAAQSAPEVHIRIGRIDIRGVAPAPAPVTRPAPQKSAAPTLDLQGYLRGLDRRTR